MLRRRRTPCVTASSGCPSPRINPCGAPNSIPEPLRVSVIQSGSFAGPLGSSVGQQPFREGLVVRQEQPTFLGYAPRYGHLEIRMRGTLTERSMFALWLSGIEDEVGHSGEICVVEIFGSGIRDGTAEVGMGIHRFRDPSLEEAFSVLPLAVDVREFHTYALDWRPGSVEFSVDERPVHRLDQAPDYADAADAGRVRLPRPSGRSDGRGARARAGRVAHQGRPTRLKREAGALAATTLSAPRRPGPSCAPR